MVFWAASLCACVLLLCLGYISSSNEFVLLFPRDGELLLVNKDKSVDVCFYFYVTQAGLIQLPVNVTQNFMASTTLLGARAIYDFNLTFSPPMKPPPLQRFCLAVMDVEGAIGMHLSLVITNKSSGEVVITFERQAILGEESDVSFSPAQVTSGAGDPHEASNKLDFIEIGTSYFNTCMVYKHLVCLRESNIIAAEGEFVCNRIHASSGISVDVVLDYLNRIPNYSHVQKYHMAITADQSGKYNSSQHSFLPVYHILPSALDKLQEVPQYMGGCTQVDNIHPGIYELLFMNEFYPASLLQKSWVRTMSIRNFLEKHVHSPVRLFKVDVEGLDADLIHGAIDYYQHQQHQQQEQLGVPVSDSSQSQSVGPNWPCMFIFEKEMLSDDVAAAVSERLSTTGYREVAVDSVDSAYINCWCPPYDFDIISMYVVLENYVQLNASLLVEVCQGYSK